MEIIRENIRKWLRQKFSFIFKGNGINSTFDQSIENQDNYRLPGRYELL